MKLSLFFIFILLLPSVIAFDCSGLGEDCEVLKDVDESLISNLIYKDTSFANHEFVKEYNDNIEVSNPPYDAEVKSNGYVKNVWFSFLIVFPSIIEEDQLIVQDTFTLRSEHDYSYQVPSTYRNNRKSVGRICKIYYNLHSTSEQLMIFANGEYLSSEKVALFSISQPSEFKGEYTATVTVRKRIYEWYRDEWDWYCEYDRTEYQASTATVEDSINLVPYQPFENPKFTIIHEYKGNQQGKISNQNHNLKINLGDASYKETNYQYSTTFSKAPYNFLVLKAQNISHTEVRNVNVQNSTLVAKASDECNIEYSTHFDTNQIECQYETVPLSLKEFEKSYFSKSWNFLFFMGVFIFICYIIYVAIKHTWGKYVIAPFCFILMAPIAFAEECGLTNLAACIPEKFFGSLLHLLNEPLQPLLDLIRAMLESAPSIEAFLGIWAIMVYCVSLFYGFLFFYSGFQFLFSGHDVIKREMAKEWLKNTVIMIILVQASYYLYELILELGAVLSSSVLSMVDEQFFLLSADGLSNMGLEILFVGLYALTLLITVLMLIIRYLIVAFGVIYIPLGIFCYFIPPLKSYGKLILHMLGMFIFITFIDAVLILACSMLIELPIFTDMKILVMISCFTMINVLFVILLFKSIMKAVFSSGHTDNVAQAVKYIAMMV